VQQSLGVLEVMRRREYNLRKHLEHDCEVVCRGAISAREDKVIDTVSGKRRLAAHRIHEGDVAAILGHLDAPNVRLSRRDARERGLGVDRAARAVVPSEATARTSGLPFGRELLGGAEARVRVARGLELLQALGVQVKALRLEVGAHVATDLGPLVVVEPEELHRADDCLGVLGG
jgi:hypothetical protein